MPCRHPFLLLILYLHTALRTYLFHCPNNAYSLLFTAGTPGFFESVSITILAKPVLSCLFVFAVSECVRNMEGVGGSTCPFTSCGFRHIPFINTLFQMQGTGCFVYITTAFCWGSNHPNTSLSRRLFLRRSMFLSYLWHGLRVTAQLGEFLEKDLTSVRANFRKTYLKLECDSLAPDFLQLSLHLIWPWVSVDGLGNGSLPGPALTLLIRMTSRQFLWNLAVLTGGSLSKL